MAATLARTPDFRTATLKEIQDYLAEIDEAKRLITEHEAFIETRRRAADAFNEAQTLLRQEQTLEAVLVKLRDPNNWSDYWPWNWGDRAARRQLTPREERILADLGIAKVENDVEDYITSVIQTEPTYPPSGDLTPLRTAVSDADTDIATSEASINAHTILSDPALRGKDTTIDELEDVRDDAEPHETRLLNNRGARARRNFNARRRGTGGPAIAPASGSALRRIAAGLVGAGLVGYGVYDFTNDGPVSTTLANLGSHGIDLTTGSVASLGWPSMDWISFENIDFSSLSEFLSSSASVGGLTVPMLPVLLGGLFALNEFRKGNIVKGFGVLTKSVITGTSLALLASTMYTMPAIASATLLGAATPTIIVAGTMVVAGAGLGYLLGRMIPPFFGKQNFTTSLGYGAVISALTLGFIHTDQVANFFSGDATVSTEPVSGDLTARVETLERELATARETIEGKDARIVELEGSETTLKAKLATANETIAAKDARIAELEGVERDGVERDGVETGLSTTVLAEIAALKSQIAGLTSEIAALKTAGVTIDASVLESLNERIAALEADALTSEETIAGLRDDIAEYRLENERLREALAAERAEHDFRDGLEDGEYDGERVGLALAEGGKACSAGTLDKLELDAERLTLRGSAYDRGFDLGFFEAKADAYAGACSATIDANEFLHQFSTEAAKDTLGMLIDGTTDNDVTAMKRIAILLGDDLSPAARESIASMTEKHFVDPKHFVEFMEGWRALGPSADPIAMKEYIVDGLNDLAEKVKLDNPNTYDKEWFADSKARISTWQTVFGLK